MKNIKDLETQYEKLGIEIEKLKKEQSEIKQYDIVKFGQFEWYVIEKKDEILTLFLKDKLSADQCEKYFDESLLDSDKDVKFSNDIKNIWWADSPIRMVLNSVFLEDLDKSKMKLMTTKVSIDCQSRLTEDYVRLITKEEVEKLPAYINKSSCYGYWTMSPSLFFYWGNAHEFIVYSSGGLTLDYVTDGYGVRPVIQIAYDNTFQE